MHMKLHNLCMNLHNLYKNLYMNAHEPEYWVPHQYKLCGTPVPHRGVGQGRLARGLGDAKTGMRAEGFEPPSAKGLPGAEP